MPSRSPFTRLCQQTSKVRERGRADLHVHSTHSDGLYTPAEVVAIARKAGLTAVAITDHDTLSGCLEAKSIATGLEVISGVEITTEFNEREMHLLGYFVSPDHAGLAHELQEVRRQRHERFEAIAGRLCELGVSVDDGAMRSLLDDGATLSRRHMARLLVDGKHAGNLHDAFARYLCLPEIQELPKYRIPVAEAIRLVRAAGGVSSWAHPRPDSTIDEMRELQALGLNAVECEYPWAKASHGRRLRTMSEGLGLAVTGGSDCHGPQPNCRAIGVRGINRVELDRIRMLVGSP